MARLRIVKVKPTEERQSISVDTIEGDNCISCFESLVARSPRAGVHTAEFQKTPLFFMPFRFLDSK